MLSASPELQAPTEKQAQGYILKPRVLFCPLISPASFPSFSSLKLAETWSYLSLPPTFTYKSQLGNEPKQAWPSENKLPSKLDFSPLPLPQQRSNN